MFRGMGGFWEKVAKDFLEEWGERACEGLGDWESLLLWVKPQKGLKWSYVVKCCEGWSYSHPNEFGE